MFVASPWLGKRKETYYVVGIVVGLAAGWFLMYKFVPDKLKYLWLAVGAALHGKLSWGVWYERAWPYTADALLVYVVGASILGVSAAHLMLGEIDVRTHRVGDVVGWLLAFAAGSFLVFAVQDPVERSIVFSVLCVLYASSYAYDQFRANAAAAMREIEEQERADWGVALTDPPAPRREFTSIEEYNRLGEDTTRHAVGLLVDDPKFKRWFVENHHRVYVPRPPDPKPLWRHGVTLAILGAGALVYAVLVQRAV